MTTTDDGTDARPARALGRAAHTDRRLLVALASAFAYHGVLLVSGTFRGTYDAYVHIFFADHYRRWWFDHWDPRWYTGFPVTSYPPGSHQSVALLSHGVGLEAAFIIVQLTAVLLVVAGVYRFARLWVSQEAAGTAALLAVVSTSIAETVHVFGQLPTMLSLGFLLNATPWVHRWVVHGGRTNLLAATSVTAATTAAHHVTTLFGAVFILGPVIVAALVQRLGEPLPDETGGRPVAVTRANLGPLAARRLRRIVRPTLRAGVYAVTLVVVLVTVVLPYWLWSGSDPITQLPIPHASRSDFLDDLNAGLVFWLVPWGLYVLALPYALWRGARSRGWPLAASLALLALLGTGGTTPLPRLLLRGAFDILTLDRFTFWATILILPFAGELVAGLGQGRTADALRRRHAALPTAVATLLAVAALGASMGVANLTQLRPMQPDPIDPDPIVAFLDKDQHDRWRYLTLGFGDQLAWLSANTTAQTVDGNYHSARRLPELVTTPVERLEGAKFRGVPGIGSLQQFLTVPEKYHLKFVFSADEFYDPLLHYSGWHRLDRLVNGVVVWEREDVTPLPAVLPRREIPTYQRLMWGTLPMTALVVAALTLAAAVGRRRRAPLPEPAPRRVTARVDAALATRARGVDADAVAPVRLIGVLARLRHSTTRIADRAGASPLLRVLVVGAVALPLIATGLALLPQGRTIEDTLVEYHHALDIRDLRGAYALLDPDARPSYDEFVLARSVEDGLVPGYSSLDDAQVRVLERSDERARAEIELSYVTSLDGYELTEAAALRRTTDGWRIQLPPTDVSLPVERFATRAGIDAVTQGRRRLTTERTSYADVLDRPEIALVDARLVERDSRYSVVGQLVNTDARPADITVTAMLTGPDGQVLTRYDAGQLISHKVLPQGVTAFRIDFEGVAGALRVDDPAAGVFSPGASSPFQLGSDDVVAGVDVYAKAVVSGRELERPLGLQRLRIEGGAIVGEVINTGTADATVPSVLATWLDDDGVAWVDRVYLDRNVRPGRARDVAVPLPDLTDVRRIEVRVRLFDNGLLDRVWDTFVPPADLTLSTHPGVTSARLDATTFERSTR